MQGSYLLMCLGGCQTPWQQSSSPLWGGGEKKYIYIYTQGSPPHPLSAAASSLCLHGHVGLLFCAGLLGDGGWPACGLRRRGRSPHALLLPGRRSRGPGGVEGPVLGQRRGRGWWGGRHGGHGATAVEAFGSLEAGEHGEGVGEVGRCGRRIGGSAHLWEGDMGSGESSPSASHQAWHKTPLPPLLWHMEPPDLRSADCAAHEQLNLRV